MKALLIRFVVIGSLFLGGSFLASVTLQSYLALPIWYLAVAIWTLTLGLRKALWIIIPFLVVADVLWDGKIGAVFLAGFLLATLTTYLEIRIETRSRSLQVLVYSFLVGLASAFVLTIGLGWPNFFFPASSLTLLLGIFSLQWLAAIVFFLPLSSYLRAIENLLSISYREQSKKIR